MFVCQLGGVSVCVPPTKLSAPSGGLGVTLDHKELLTPCTQDASNTSSTLLHSLSRHGRGSKRARHVPGPPRTRTQPQPREPTGEVASQGLHSCFRSLYQARAESGEGFDWPALCNGDGGHQPQCVLSLGRGRGQGDAVTPAQVWEERGADRYLLAKGSHSVSWMRH